MKTVIIIAERLTESALSAVVPAAGVASVCVTSNRSGVRNDGAIESYRSFRNPRRFNPAIRIEMVVEDRAAGTVFDAVDFAYGAGFFSDAEMWLESAEISPAA